MGGRRKIRRSGALGTGSEKARLGGTAAAAAAAIVSGLPSTTRAASLPSLYPPAPRPASSRMLARW